MCVRERREREKKKIFCARYGKGRYSIASKHLGAMSASDCVCSRLERSLPFNFRLEFSELHSFRSLLFSHLLFLLAVLHLISSMFYFKVNQSFLSCFPFLCSFFHNPDTSDTDRNQHYITCFKWILFIILNHKEIL